ncbi:disulfide bond formation protein B [Oleisolibacter albus]|uniref:disulfide bond formation protein B n=1 Tax=Oleisolibacter albus TaxID=2171757 RepID=UPI000DF25717|nr:disulfide bond formation protein B [Oleisolibacter albus]
MIDRILALLAAPRLPVLGFIGICVAALATAFIAEYVFGLLPCEMCILERWAYAGTIGVLLPGLTMADRPQARSLVLALGALGFLVGAVLSFIHVGIEQHWWQGFTGCTADVSIGGGLDDLRSQILAAPVVRCDDVPWSLFGISIAGFNLLATVGLTVAAALSAILTLRCGRGRGA